MIEIKDLLNKWTVAILSEEGKKDAVARAIGEAVGVSLNKEDIKIQNGKVYLNLNPVYKNEIFIKQEKILSVLEERFGKTAPKKIF